VNEEKDKYSDIINKSLMDMDSKELCSSDERRLRVRNFRVWPERSPRTVPVLLVAALLSFGILNYQQRVREASFSNLRLANCTILEEIERVPQSSRARGAALAISEFVFAMVEVLPLSENREQRSQDLLHILHERLEIVAEDPETIRRFNVIRTIFSGAIEVVER